MQPMVEGQAFGNPSTTLFAALLDYARASDNHTAAKRLVKIALLGEDKSQAATIVYKKMLGNIEIHITEVSAS